MKVEPLLNRVVLKQVKTERSNSGLIISHDGQKAADRATVLAVGPGLLDVETGKFVPCSLKPDDTVLINPYLGMRAKVNGQEVIIQKEEEILARVLPEETNG